MLAPHFGQLILRRSSATSAGSGVTDWACAQARRRLTISA
jgi:hypothetical protein